MKALINRPALTPKHLLTEWVESKVSYNTQSCELHIFETHRSAQDYSLKFNDLTFTAMIRGKKLVSLGGEAQRFEYLPGYSVIVAPQEEMLIDFPEADLEPSQCLALTINREYIQKTLEQLNATDVKLNDNGQWLISPDEYFISNDEGLTAATNNIMRVFLEDNPMKELFTEMALKELIVRMSQSQAYSLLQKGKMNGRFADLISYIKANLNQKLYIDKLAKFVQLSTSNFYKIFKQEVGMSPNEYILQIRIDKAKELLMHPISVNEVAYETGFSDANYFIKIFKKMVGTTPKHYQMQWRSI